jgi:sterol desaturase/sphingolipid hydroxylase (fatty acid hydroxylase superfamily)
VLALLWAAATLEGLVLSWRQPGCYDWRAYASSIADAALRGLVELLGLSLAAPLLVWAWQHRLTTLPIDSAAALAGLFIGEELCYYAYHRAAHRVRWFWASHAVHHSPSQLTLATAVRLGWTGKLTGTAIFFAPLVWLGFSPQAVAAAVAFNLLYQFWIHSDWLPRLWAPIEWCFNTPSHHRVHHACHAPYLDRNFGGVLIVFDRLFGSFTAERDDLPPRYGLASPITTYNPLRIALHEWVRMAGELRAARDGRTVWRVLFGPPPGPGPAG